MSKTSIVSLVLLIIVPCVAMEKQTIQSLKGNCAKSVQLRLVANQQPLFSGIDLCNDLERNQIVNVSDISVNNTLDYGLGIFDYQGNNTGKLLGHTEYAYCLTKLPDDPDRLVSGGTDAQVIFWDLTNNKPLQKMKANEQILCLLALGNNLVVAGGGDVTLPDSDLSIWNLQTGEPLPCVGHQTPVFKLVKPDNGTWFASSSAWMGAGQTRVWDFKGNPLASLNTGDSLAVYDKYLVTGDKEINVYDSENNFSRVGILDTQQKWVEVIRFADLDQNETMMVTGGKDCRAIIYTVQLGQGLFKQIATCNGHFSPISDLKIVPKDGVIVTISAPDSTRGDTSLRVWDFNGNQLARMDNTNPRCSLRVIKEIGQDLFAIGADLNFLIVQMQVSNQGELSIVANDKAEDSKLELGLQQPLTKPLALVQKIREKRMPQGVDHSNKEEVNNIQSNATTGRFTSCNMQ